MLILQKIGYAFKFQRQKPTSQGFLVNTEEWVMLIKKDVALRLDVPNENFLLQFEITCQAVKQ